MQVTEGGYAGVGDVSRCWVIRELPDGVQFGRFRPWRLLNSTALTRYCFGRF